MPLMLVTVCGSLVPFWRVEGSTLNKNLAVIVNPSVGGQPRTDYVHMQLHALYSGESGFAINYLTLCALFFFVFWARVERDRLLLFDAASGR